MTLVQAPSARRRRTWAAWLGLLVLAFNLVAGIVLPLRQTDAMAGGMVVCTAAGMVVLDENGNPIPQSAEAGTLCACCLPLAHGYPAPQALALAVPGEWIAAELAEWVQAPRRSPVLLDASARAPPIA